MALRMIIDAFCNSCIHIKKSLLNFRRVLRIRSVLLRTHRSDNPSLNKSNRLLKNAICKSID